MSNLFGFLFQGAGGRYGPIRLETGPAKVLGACTLIFLAVMLAGCTQSESSDSSPVASPDTAQLALPTPAPTLIPSPISTRVMPVELLTPLPTSTVTPIPAETVGLVVEVIDGNTIAVVLDGNSAQKAYVVRYIGIDAPPNTDAWGVVARETNKKLTNLKVVRLVRDQEDFDEDGKLLRYVYVDDQLLSIILTEQGLATAKNEEPNSNFESEISSAEARARAGRLGLWGQQPPTATTQSSDRAAEETPASPATAAPEATESPETTEATAAPENTSTPDAEPTAASTPTVTPPPELTPTATPTLELTTGSTPDSG